MNQLYCLYVGKTSDARTFKQWRDAGRHVRKGSKAFHLWKPLTGSKTDPDTKEKTTFCFGFGTFPVFRIQDTDGEPVTNAPSVDRLPLVEVAEAWGIPVEFELFRGNYYGAYNPTAEYIKLATPDESTFLHELAHAAHKRVNGTIQGGQHAGQEIVAELSAAVLAHHLGLETNLGHSYKYIETYARSIDKTAVEGCMAVLKEVKAVLALIMAMEVKLELA
jgi:antirestriction protein ArdC